MLVRDVMTSPAISVRPEATVKEAIGLMAHHDIAAMPVVDAKERVVGVVSEADVIREMVVPQAHAHGVSVRLTSPPRLAAVADVMSNHSLTVTEDTDLAMAADLLTSTVVKSLPVLDNDRLVGMLSRRDIIRLLSRQDARISAEVDEVLREAGHDWLVDVDEGVVTISGPRDDGEERLAEALASTVPGVVATSFVHGVVG